MLTVFSFFQKIPDGQLGFKNFLIFFLYEILDSLLILVTEAFLLWLKILNSKRVSLDIHNFFRHKITDNHRFISKSR